MMISPEGFAEEVKDLSYPEMIRERDKLIRFLQDFEKKEMAGDRSDPEWNRSPSATVRYQMYFEYLAALCRLMHDKYNSEYVWGDRTLKDDVEDESFSSDT